MTLDRPEHIIIDIRFQRWPEEARRWVDLLPKEQQEVVEILVAHLDARPVEESRE